MRMLYLFCFATVIYISVSFHRALAVAIGGPFGQTDGFYGVFYLNKIGRIHRIVYSMLSLHRR